MSKLTADTKKNKIIKQFWAKYLNLPFVCVNVKFIQKCNLETDSYSRFMRYIENKRLFSILFFESMINVWRKNEDVFTPLSEQLKTKRVGDVKRFPGSDNL